MGQLRLEFVVIDVVVADNFGFRCIARLAGAQNNAHGVHVQIVAQGAHQFQSGVFLLHDDVKQQYRNIAPIV